MDLTIVGAGELGLRVGRLWRQAQPRTSVTAETLTAVRHGTLKLAGLIPSLRSLRAETLSRRVVFAIPPSAGVAYVSEVEQAIQIWDRTAPFVLISSTGVYSSKGGEKVNEYSEVATHSRAALLTQAERLVLAWGGSVIRMAGLYCLHRGPHRHYARTGDSPYRGDGLVNLIHYEDAAALVVARLRSETSAGTYLGSDNHPIARAEIVRLSAEFLKLRSQVHFQGTETEVGKICDSTITQAALGWSPKIESFEWFCRNLSSIEEIAR